MLVLFIILVLSLPFFGLFIGRKIGGFFERNSEDKNTNKTVFNDYSQHVHYHQNLTVVDEETKEKAKYHHTINKIKYEQ